jgi:sigma-B regulation protein RsbU (phosphoserine phosphatase)
MEGELQTARAIQMSMLPKQFPPFPERNDLDVFAQLTPAKEVGGDLYDFYIRDEKLFFCIGDVSGKGVPAALVMAVTRGLFRSFSARESNPAKIIANINDAITQRNETEMFVTFFLGVLDLPSGRLHYCNAAHCPPILFGKEMGLLPIIPNVPLGIIPKFKFQSQETKLTTNTIIFAYTDGLTEATDSAPALYGEERMLQVADQLHNQSSVTPKEILHEMENSVKEFVGSAEQSDDLTMLCIQYLRLQRDIKLKRSLILPNDIETIPQLNVFIDQAAEDAPLPPDLSMSLNLAIEEAVVNVMSYAYPRGTHGDVIIDLSVTDQQLTIAIIDQGMPFDPTSQVEADTSLSVEDRPIGGLGIYLVRQLMDSINYERIDGKNVLTLIKKLT